MAACSPYYFPYTDADLYRYYSELADSAPAPLVLYNIPQNTHVSLSRALVEKCSGHGNIVGIKDSSGDSERFRGLLSLSRPDFTVLQGTDERNAATYFSWGCDGYVSGLENITPGLLRELRTAVSCPRHEEGAFGGGTAADGRRCHRAGLLAVGNQIRHEPIRRRHRSAGRTAAGAQ